MDYSHDSRCEENPADVEEGGGLMADHLLDAVAEAPSTEDPRYGYGLEEDQKQHRHPARRVIIQYLEDINTALNQFQYHFNQTTLHSPKNLKECRIIMR